MIGVGIVVTGTGLVALISIGSLVAVGALSIIITLLVATLIILTVGTLRGPHLQQQMMNSFHDRAMRCESVRCGGVCFSFRSSP